MSNISPVLLREEIARRLRAARKAADVSSEDAAQKLDMTRSNLSRIESGRQGVNVHLVRTMMDIYDFRDDEMLEMVRDSRKPGWWKSYGLSDRHFIALEAGAQRACTFEVQLVPGLLQTADYARAVFESGRQPISEAELADLLNARLIRQDRLTDDEYPLHLVAVIDENALRRPVGGSGVMRAQLQHLALVAELPTVTLRLLPTAAVSNESTYGRFDILEFPQQPTIAYVHHTFGEERTAVPGLVEVARLRFEHLQLLALGPDESAARFERVSDELWSG